MGKVHDRMDRELRIGGYAENTRKSYLEKMRCFVRHFRRPPDELTAEHVKQYQLFLTRDKRVSWSTFNVHVCATRFFYREVLRVEWDVEHIPYQKRGRRLPVVLSGEEVRALLELAVGACARGEPEALVVTRDSAGVTIVESSGPSWTPETAWVVESAPLLDLGLTGSGPMHEFFRVADATFGAGGGSVVANRGSAQVRFYDAAGRFTAALGADRDGPGEFRRLMGVARHAGDSVVAFDPSVGRGTVISASGTLGRVVTFDIPDNTRTTPFVDDLHVPESGGFFVSVTVMPAGRPSAGRVRIPQIVLATSTTGVVQDTVAGMSGFEQYVGPSGLAEPPFALLSHGAVHGDELYVCDGGQPEYTVFAATER